MPEPKPVLSEEEIRDIGNTTEDECGFLGHVENAIAFARRIESAVLAKRDAMWREAAREECYTGRVIIPGTCAENKVTPCSACRTVARMEER